MNCTIVWLTSMFDTLIRFQILSLNWPPGQIVSLNYAVSTSGCCSSVFPSSCCSTSWSKSGMWTMWKSVWTVSWRKWCFSLQITQSPDKTLEKTFRLVKKKVKRWVLPHLPLPVLEFVMWWYVSACYIRTFTSDIYWHNRHLLTLLIHCWLTMTLQMHYGMSY